MNIFLLDDAISCLDSDLLKEHLNAKKCNRIRSNKHRWSLLKLILAAACVCLIITSAIVILSNIDNIFSDEVIQNIYFEGETIKTQSFNLSLMNVNQETGVCTFELENKTNEHKGMYLIFNGWIVTREFIDDQGVLCYDTDDYDVITPYPDYVSKFGYIVVDNLLKITVNGEDVDAIPTEKGKYIIEIDYGEMYTTMDHVEPMVSVNGIAYFVFDKELFGR